MEYKSTLMSPEELSRALRRVAHQIIEKNHGTDGLCLIGIRTRGVPLAYRLADNMDFDRHLFLTHALANTRTLYVIT